MQFSYTETDLFTSTVNKPALPGYKRSYKNIYIYMFFYFLSKQIQTNAGNGTENGEQSKY